MPRAPIKARRGFVYKINHHLKLVAPFDWNAVDTELGVMVEQRQSYDRMVEGKIVDNDPVDSAYDSITEIEEGAFHNQYNTSGPAFPRDFKY